MCAQTAYQKEYYYKNRAHILKRNQDNYRKNKDEILARHQRYREEHREEIKESSRKYGEKNKERIREHVKIVHATPEYKRKYKAYIQEYRKREHTKQLERAKSKRWKAKNPEYCKVQLRKWQQDNPDKVRRLSHNRRAVLRNCEGTYAVDDIKTMFNTQDGRCFYCNCLLYCSRKLTYLGVTIHNNICYHIDHKIPISRGGSNYIENIVISCPRCNISKNNKTAEEFIKHMETKK